MNYVASSNFSTSTAATNTSTTGGPGATNPIGDVYVFVVVHSEGVNVASMSDTQANSWTLMTPFVCTDGFKCTIGYMTAATANFLTATVTLDSAAGYYRSRSLYQLRPEVGDTLGTIHLDSGDDSGSGAGTVDLADHDSDFARAFLLLHTLYGGSNAAGYSNGAPSDPTDWTHIASDTNSSSGPPLDGSTGSITDHDWELGRWYLDDAIREDAVAITKAFGTGPWTATTWRLVFPLEEVPVTDSAIFTPPKARRKVDIRELPNSVHSSMLGLDGIQGNPDRRRR